MEEQLGYIKAQIEALKEDHIETKEFLKELRSDIQKTIWDDRMEFRRVMTEHIKTEETRLKNIEDQLSLYRHFVLFVKALGLSCAFVLAFKFGDIPGLWKGIFK